MLRRISFGLLALLFCFALLLPTAQAAGDPVLLSLSEATARVGEEVTLSLSLDLNPGLTELSLGVAYDPEALELRSLSVSGLLSGAFSADRSLEAQPFTLLWVSELPMTGTGALAELCFLVKDSATGRETVSLVSLAAKGPNGDRLEVEGRDGGLAVLETGLASLRLSSAAVSPGADFELALQLEGNPGLTALSLALDYDPEALELLGAEDAGLLTADCRLGQPEELPYPMQWRSSAAFYGEGTLARLRFHAKDTAAGELRLHLLSLSATDAEGYPAKTQAFDGTVLVEPGAEPIGEGLSWSLSGDGTLRISGNGALRDCSELQPAPWASLREQIRCVIVGEGVTSIGQGAFSDCAALESVLLPGSLRELYPPNEPSCGPFSGCGALKSYVMRGENPCFSTDNGLLFDGEKRCLLACPSGKSGTLSLPESMSSAADWAFCACRLLRTLSLPEGTEALGAGAFSDCSGLLWLRFGEKLSSLGARCFSGCVSLRLLSFSGDAPSLGEDCFSGLEAVAFTPESPTWRTLWGTQTLRREEYTAEDGLLAAGSCGRALRWRFTDDGLLSIDGVGPMTSYKSGAAPWQSFSLPFTELSVGDGVTTLSDGAFERCLTLRRALLGRGLESVEDWAFNGCAALRTLRFLGDAPTFGDFCFAELSAELLYPARAKGWREASLLSYGATELRYTAYDPASPPPVPGDANADGWVNGRDAILLTQKLAGWARTVSEAADLNGDGLLDGSDAVALLQLLL